MFLKRCSPLTLISAIYLMRKQHQLFVLPRGFIPKVRALLGSTPYLSYSRSVIKPRGELLTQQVSGAAQ